MKFSSPGDDIQTNEFIPKIVAGLCPAHPNPWPQMESFNNLFVQQNHEIEERISVVLNNTKNIKYRKYNEDFRKSLPFQRTVSNNILNYSNHIFPESEGKTVKRPISQASWEN